LRRFAAEAGVREYMETHGRLPHQRTLAQIRTSRALVLPSLCFENSPLAVYEALAWGTPPIVSDRGGTEELFRSGVHGYVLDPTKEDAWWESVRILLTDDELYHRMRSAAWRLARENYSMTDHIRAIEGIYDSVV
jgi:glycosyltransferase involved in cell wall biosynthesis